MIIIMQKATMKKAISLIASILLALIMLCGCEKTLTNESSLLNDTDKSSQKVFSDIKENTESSEKTENNKDKSETKPKKEIIDISSDAYYDLIKKIFEEATQQNGYYVFQSCNTYRAPYLQVYIAPKDIYSDEATKTQSTELIENILDQLKKYEYKSGGFFKRECKYINIYFYGLDDNGSYHRNGGPFIQISLFDIQNETVEGLTF